MIVKRDEAIKIITKYVERRMHEEFPEEVHECEVLPKFFEVCSNHRDYFSKMRDPH